MTTMTKFERLHNRYWEICDALAPYEFGDLLNPLPTPVGYEALCAARDRIAAEVKALPPLFVSDEQYEYENRDESEVQSGPRERWEGIR